MKNSFRDANEIPRYRVVPWVENQLKPWPITVHSDSYLLLLLTQKSLFIHVQCRMIAKNLIASNNRKNGTTDRRHIFSHHCATFSFRTLSSCRPGPESRRMRCPRERIVPRRYYAGALCQTWRAEKTRRRLFPFHFHFTAVKVTVLSRYVGSIFAFTRALYPWGNFPEVNEAEKTNTRHFSLEFSIEIHL